MNEPLRPPETTSLEVAYQEAWKEYHHTEQIIFVFLGFVATVNAAIIQNSKLGLPNVTSLMMATIVGLFAILVTYRQVQSRSHRIHNVIPILEVALRLPRMSEGDHMLGLGTIMKLISWFLFLFPLSLLLYSLTKVCAGL